MQDPSRHPADEPQARPPKANGRLPGRSIARLVLIAAIVIGLLVTIFGPQLAASLVR